MEYQQHFITVCFLKLAILIILSVYITESFRHGEYLDSDSFKQLNNIGLKQCAKRCYAEAGCQSINFIKSRFNCMFSHYNGEEKPFLLDSDYIYGDRNDMSKILSDFVECPDEHILMKMHDGRNYCYRTSTCNSRLMWQNNSEVTVTASSTYPACSLDKASLYYTNDVQRHHAWCAGKGFMPDEFIQIEFSVIYEIQSIMTQGCGYGTHWLTSYSVNSSDDGISWTQIGGDFQGNNDSNTVVTNKLPGNVKTTYLRIIPETYQNYPSCRFDLIACRV